MGWVDYKKAHDMVPHDWIERWLELFGIHESVRRLMTVSMAQWKLNLLNGTNNVGSAAIQRGIF